MAINKTQKKKTTDFAHKNHMGGESYDINNPLLRLRTAAASSFFGEPSYYNDGSDKPKTSMKLRSYEIQKKVSESLGLSSIIPETIYSLPTNKAMEKTIDEALNFSVEETLKVAVELRNTDNIRTTPQVILVRAANHPKSKGTDLIRKYAKQIVLRGDEPAVCIAYQLSVFGKKIPSSLKRALADKLESMNEYDLNKYKMQSRTVKTVDVVNLVHPKATLPLNKLMKGELKLADETWEAIRSAGKPWSEAIPVMGHMALLRNLRNFAESGVPEDLYLPKLVSTAAKGKQLPFRYLTAYRELKAVRASARVLDSIEECLEISFQNVPKFAGRTMSLCDNSGSAHGTFTSDLGSTKVSDIANLTAIVTARQSDSGHVGVFGDKLETFEVRKKSSIFDEVLKATDIGNRIGHGTENGIWLFWKNAIETKEHWDNVFIYSDMQAGHGGLYGLTPSEYSDYSWYGRNIDVCKLISTYRKTVNKNVNVFMVQVAGYQDSIVPEFYQRTYILGGWSANILTFAKKMIDLHDQ